MKKALIMATLAMGVLATAQAATELYVTGATAFRGSLFSALSVAGNWTAAPEVVGTGSASQYSFAGTWNRSDVGGIPAGTALKVYCSFSGSVEGINSLLNPDNPTYSHLPVADGVSGNFTHVANMAFSDVYQATTAYAPNYGYATLGDVVVGVQAFVFAGNQKAINSNVVCICYQQFRAMAPNGQLPIAQFIGNGDFTTPVYLTGRNSFSGTRTTVFAETGFGVFKSCKQYRNGTTSLTPQGRIGRVADLANVTLFPVNDGWDSGGSVRADLNSALNTTDLLVGYLSAGDARSLLGNSGTTADFWTHYLAYCCANFTKQNVINGKYHLWGNEHLMVNSPAGSDPAKGQISLKAACDAYLIGAYCADDYPGAIPLSAMQVSRTADGGVIQ